MLFSEELRAQAQPIMTAIHEHPFVRGIATGYVPREALIFYVEQDFQYLSEFIKIYANAITKLKDREEMKFFANSINFILNSEIHPHHVFCDIADVAYETLQHATPAPKAYLYESHMYRAADTGSLLNILAAFQPCPWTYSEIAQKQTKEHANHKNNPFKSWIDFYAKSANESEGSLSNSVFQWIDRLAENATPQQRQQAMQFFLKSCELEWQFWEQAYHQEDWHFKELLTTEKNSHNKKLSYNRKTTIQ
ncbi:aminopyrimidine aminohydrolase [Leuconostoc litchii]|uniref:Aminopyrimidine aminohydrolase n=1 Tax=Leuconostoc litchii TaxID=1981069 RepID=A0A6P2CKD5_9LACO|nr:thiaminase II [Leuconostoc litchii]TYC46179.1 thiaminase II [Leuconostoc litchii]GMA70366.1 aminopyrimidine aminohydrolase [Leuconostoc litchii]